MFSTLAKFPHYSKYITLILLAETVEFVHIEDVCSSSNNYDSCFDSVHGYNPCKDISCYEAVFFFLFFLCWFPSFPTGRSHDHDHQDVGGWIVLKWFLGKDYFCSHIEISHTECLISTLTNFSEWSPY
jgi:hypothetical protein